MFLKSGSVTMTRQSADIYRLFMPNYASHLLWDFVYFTLYCHFAALKSMICWIYRKHIFYHFFYDRSNAYIVRLQSELVHQIQLACLLLFQTLSRLIYLFIIHQSFNRQLIYLSICSCRAQTAAFIKFSCDSIIMSGKDNPSKQKHHYQLVVWTTERLNFFEPLKQIYSMHLSLTKCDFI